MTVKVKLINAAFEPNNSTTGDGFVSSVFDFLIKETGNSGNISATVSVNQDGHSKSLDALHVNALKKLKDFLSGAIATIDENETRRLQQ